MWVFKKIKTNWLFFMKWTSLTIHTLALEALCKFLDKVLTLHNRCCGLFNKMYTEWLCSSLLDEQWAVIKIFVVWGHEIWNVMKFTEDCTSVEMPAAENICLKEFFSFITNHTLIRLEQLYTPFRSRDFTSHCVLYTALILQVLIIRSNKHCRITCDGRHKHHLQWCEKQGNYDKKLTYHLYH